MDEDNEQNNIDDEYGELDSIDEKMIKMHHKYISDFIIRNDNQNEEEILKIQNFMQYNPNMLFSDNKVKIDNSKDYNNEINEEINLNIEDNKDGNDENNNENENKESPRNENNEQEQKENDIYKQDIQTEKGFEKI